MPLEYQPGVIRVDNLPLRLIAVPLTLTDFALLGADPAALTVGEPSSPTVVIAGQTANNNAKTFDLFRQIIHHDRAAVADSIAESESTDLLNASLVVRARRTGTPNASASLLGSCFRSDGEGGVDTSIGSSGQLVTVGSLDLLSESESEWNDFEIPLDFSDVERGDPVNISLRATIDDTGGSGGGEIEIGQVVLRMYVHL